MNRARLTIFSLLLLAIGLVDPVMAGTIKKCQDKKGQWHYGDNASVACAKSKIIEISQEGIKKREIAAPPTEKELKTRAAREEERKRQAAIDAERKRQDKLLLATYGHEKDIAYVRDRKLKQIDLTARSSRQTIESFQIILKRLEEQAAKEQRGSKKISPKTAQSITRIKAQIAEHEKVLIASEKEKIKVVQRYERDVKRYRELKYGKQVKN